MSDPLREQAREMCRKWGGDNQHHANGGLCGHCEYILDALRATVRECVDLMENIEDNGYNCGGLARTDVLIAGILKRFGLEAE